MTLTMALNLIPKTICGAPSVPPELRGLGAALLLTSSALAATPGEAPSEGPGKPATKVYRYNSGGTVSFSDRPPGHDNFVVLSFDCYACNPKSSVNWRVTRLFQHEFADEINVAARRYNVDPALVRAVIHAESGFNVHARSRKGAMGLMQLMPATARMMGVRNVRVPNENIHGGVRYLAELLSQFRHDVTLATAAYNAGPDAVQRYAGVPPYPETQVYVQRVRMLHQRYKSPSEI